MKLIRKICFLIFVCNIFLIVGCGLNNESIKKQNESSETISTSNQQTKGYESDNPKILISWDFSKYSKNDDIGFETPYSDAFLVIKGQDEKKIEIGSYMGEFSVSDDLSDGDYPKDTLIACAAWYAGAGDDLIVIRKDSTTLAILWREEDEGNEGDECYKSEFKEIKTVEIPKDAEIEVVNKE